MVKCGRVLIWKPRRNKVTSDKKKQLNREGTTDCVQKKKGTDSRWGGWGLINLSKGTPGEKKTKGTKTQPELNESGEKPRGRLETAGGRAQGSRNFKKGKKYQISHRPEYPSLDGLFYRPQATLKKKMKSQCNRLKSHLYL